MITFKQFFKESVDKIPVLDGRREIYMANATITVFKHRNSNANVTELYRLDYEEEEVFDRSIKAYTGNNFDEARTSLLHHMQMSTNLNHSVTIKQLLEQVDKLKAVVGTFKISTYEKVKFTHIFEYIWFGVEVDKHAYKGINHAQDDLKGF